MALTPDDKIRIARKHEPVLYFHPGERYFPCDPKRYLEHAALWTSTPASDQRQNWGKPSTVFLREPIIGKNLIAAADGETQGGRTFLGSPAAGHPFLVSTPARELSLDLGGWQDSQDVTATSENRYPSLDQIKDRYDAIPALKGSQNWYYADVMDRSEVIELERFKSLPGFNSLSVMDQFSEPIVVVYHFFYPAHEEPLEGCENWGAGQQFGSYAGAWSCAAVFLNGENNPEFIGLSSRDVSPRNPRDDESRVGLEVFPWNQAEHLNDHAKVFVSRGTHGNFLKTGVHPAFPKTSADFDFSTNHCGTIEDLDQVISDGAGRGGEDADVLILLLKGIPTLGLGIFWASAEGAFSSFGTAASPPTPPVDQTSDGTAFKRIIRPEGLDPAEIPEAPAAAEVVPWAAKQFTSAESRSYDFVIDRSSQVWWPTRINEPGFQGRWGSRVTHDPKTRRAGMRLPEFWLMFLRAIAVFQSKP